VIEIPNLTEEQQDAVERLIDEKIFLAVADRLAKIEKEALHTESDISMLRKGLLDVGGAQREILQGFLLTIKGVQNNG